MTEEAPKLQVVPIEDLDKIEKLLDVSISLVNMPNLPAIKQACMEELVQYNAALAEAQQAARETFNKESAEYEARKRAAEQEKLAEADKKKATLNEKYPPSREPEPAERRM